MSAQQRTIAKDIKLSGHGVHSGEAATVTLKPGRCG
jgi:UDP-3-O-acyl-N-acetylglucosamine deacetylase